jgi:cytochrome c556
MHRLSTLAVVAALVVVGALCADEPKKDDKTPKRPTEEVLKQLQEMMTKVHKGEKAPLARVATEMKKESPDWEQLTKDAKSFVEMGKALDESGHYGRARYTEGAQALAKAVEKKDKDASAKAFATLSKSCSACHYGNPAK